ncbi:MAG: 16S rRNA (guanine(966)-N(2))-methyltransferase RsmD [Acidiferrobacterales bacterium]|nr:16S rRNA (guanine(966)-N(2))-methyltransferase RsmD [Acidiferrobacterales bacterium]
MRQSDNLYTADSRTFVITATGRVNLQGKLRIIGGKWRHREIRFDLKSDVRPTTDSARETLFNWLQTRIEGACCLDLFAGSGALGFEALSRGAAHVVFVDSSRRCTRQLERTAARLNADSFDIKCSDAARFIERTDQQFDVVFVDPPFRQGLAAPTTRLLVSSHRLASHAMIYVETEKSAVADVRPPGWIAYRRLDAGFRAHQLLMAEPGPELHAGTM